MATYYAISVSAGGRDTNYIYPQVVHMGKDYAWENSDSITRITANQPLDFRPNLRSFYLDDETRLTDLVSQGYFYTKALLASSRFTEELADMVIQPHETYPASVVFHGVSYLYSLLHMTEDVALSINYRKTRFFVRNEDGTESDVQVASADSLRDLNVKFGGVPHKSIIANNIVLDCNGPIYDLFALTLGGNVFFASDRLASALKTKALTGFRLANNSTGVSCTHYT